MRRRWRLSSPTTCSWGLSGTSTVQSPTGCTESPTLRPASEVGMGSEMEATTRGRVVRAAINGLIGDRLRDEGSRCAFDIGVRVDGRDVVLDRAGVAVAYPAATDKLVVFVHGLSENEAYWNRAALSLIHIS